MEKWISDSPDQAGETFRQFIKDFYQKNGFIEGGVEIGNETIDRARIESFLRTRPGRFFDPQVVEADIRRRGMEGAVAMYGFRDTDLRTIPSERLLMAP